MSGRGSRNCCGGVCAVVFTAGFVVLIYWANFQPRHIRASVASADLSNLTVAVDKRSNGSADVGGVVYYRLAVNLTIQNPSRRVGIYFDAIHAWLRAGASSLGEANGTLPVVFHMPRMSGTSVAVEFDYRRGGVGVTGDVAAEMVDREIKGGVVGFELEVYTRVRYRFGLVMVRAKPRVRCELRIPVKAESRRGRGSAAAGVLSPGDRCTVKY